MTPQGFVSNHAGGILGGISTGQDIVVSIAVKPTSSIRLDRRSIDKAGNAVIVNTHGRHDPCVGIRATPIAEAMLAIVLMDHALRHRAQNGDVVGARPRTRGAGARAPWPRSAGRERHRESRPGRGLRALAAMARVVSAGVLSVTCAAAAPRAKRSRSVSPTAVCAASCTMTPAAVVTML